MKNLFTRLQLIVPVAIILAGCTQSPATPTATSPAVTSTATSAVTASSTAPPVKSLGAIKIAINVPLSGDRSPLGKAIQSGAELALSQLSSPIAQLGMAVTLAPYDDQGDPDTAIANIRQMAADPAILCGIGSAHSDVMMAALDEYHKAGIPFISPGTTAPPITDPGYLEINRVSGRDDVQGIVAADFAQSLGVKSIFIAQNNSGYGRAVTTALQKRAEELGIKVFGVESIDHTSTDFGDLITKVLADKPDLVYFVAFPDQAGPFFKQTRDKGFKGTFMGPDAFDSPDLAQLAGDSLTSGGGTYYSTMTIPPNAYSGAANFIADFKAKYGTEPPPGAAQAYDAMATCLRGIENTARAKNNQLPTRSEVASAIRALPDLKGVTGTIGFNAKGDLRHASYFVYHVQTSEPARWSDNTLDKMFSEPPPQ
jgi:branched-chain amino acid transport system substrate-binding protein